MPTKMFNVINVTINSSPALQYQRIQPLRGLQVAVNSWPKYQLDWVPWQVAHSILQLHHQDRDPNPKQYKLILKQ